MKKIFAVILALCMMLSLSVPVSASTSMTFETAKAYLMNYTVTKCNTMGKEYSIQYEFSSETDLDKAAAYIAEYGLDAFTTAVDSAVDEVVSHEANTTVLARTTTPSAVYATVSEDGRHYVSGEAYGLASFDSVGTVEYSVEMGYWVTVSDGKITNLSTISFDIPTISTAGSWGDLSLPSYCLDFACGVTANYTITKTIEVGVGDFSVILKTETDNEIFTLTTNLV